MLNFGRGIVDHDHWYIHLDHLFSLFFRKQVRQWVEEAAGGQAKQFAAVVSKGTDGKIFGKQKDGR